MVHAGIAAVVEYCLAGVNRPYAVDARHGTKAEGRRPKKGAGALHTEAMEIVTRNDKAVAVTE